MFEFGFWELILIAIIGLLVLGPERLPGALRSLQKLLANVRGYAGKVQAELNHELRVKELHDHLKQVEELQQQGTENLSPELQRSLAELQQSARQVQRPYATKSDAEKKPRDDVDAEQAADKSSSTDAGKRDKDE